eukprot:9453236-Alexandrium_andersonii.AAC.1
MTRSVHRWPSLEEDGFRCQLALRSGLRGCGELPGGVRHLPAFVAVRLHANLLVGLLGGGLHGGLVRLDGRV